MRIAIRIDAADARRSLEANMPAILERAAKRVGVIVEGQTKARFDNSGDEEGAWPELWINTQRALDAIRAQQGVGAAKAKVAAEGRAQVAYERVLDKIDDGKLTGAKAIQAKRQARRKWRLARTGLPELYRRDGEPLRDSGALYNSIRHTVSRTKRGASTEIGSPLENGLYQQRGIKTKGPNYIPLTLKAKKGWSKRLVRGWDYIIAPHGVKVPPRVWMRFTDRDKRDIRETFAAVQ